MTFGVPAVQRLCVNTVDRNLYPFVFVARHDSTPIWLPVGPLQGVIQSKQYVLHEGYLLDWSAILGIIPGQEMPSILPE